MNMHGIEIQDIVEKRRGCGYRKPGGVYLRAEGTLGACIGLPIKLERCPCCGGGIKPARGWTWITIQGLYKPECIDAGECCQDQQAPTPQGCPFMPERQGLLWVGEKFYPRPTDFNTESINLGVSRRLNQIPKGLEIGNTWVFLAHRKAICEPCSQCDGKEGNTSCEECKGEGVIYVPGIFHAFKPNRIEYVVKGGEDAKELESLIRRGFNLVNVIPDNKTAAAQEQDNLFE